MKFYNYLTPHTKADFAFLALATDALMVTFKNFCIRISNILNMLNSVYKKTKNLKIINRLPRFMLWMDRHSMQQPVKTNRFIFAATVSFITCFQTSHMRSIQSYLDCCRVREHFWQ